jgi:hypothetical protein
VYCSGTSPTISHNKIVGNRATSYYGGGVYCVGGGAALIGNNVISGNAAARYGGGIYSGGTAATIWGNLITGNTGSHGGGLDIHGVAAGETATVIGNLITHNQTAYYPDGANLIVGTGSIDFCNNTVADNAGMGVEGGHLVNCVLWNNGDDLYLGTATYSCIEDGDAGTGNISADPQFADAANGDYHLKSKRGRWTASGWVVDAVHSPCIDAGDPAADFSVEPDPNGGRVNMGAYGNTAQASKSWLTTELTTTLSAGWSMLSLPMTPSPETYTDVFGDDFTLGDCVLYGWDAAQHLYASVAAADPLGGLKGYWFLSAAGGSLDATGYVAYGTTELPLQPGWNLVAAPRACLLGDLEVLHDATQLPLGDAAQTWVSSTFYLWDNALSRYATCSPTGGDSLAEWSGYWVLATEACSLIVPAPGAASAQVARSSTGSAPGPQWAFALEARVTGTGTNAAATPGTDSVVVAGAPSAGAGFDGLALDQPKAPLPPVSGVRVVLEGPTTGAAAAWTSELNQETQDWTGPDGATYRVRLTGPTGATVTLRWPDLSALPADASAWLVSPATGTRTYLRTQQSASVRLSDGAGEGSAELEVLVRPKSSTPALVTTMSATTVGTASAAAGSVDVAFTLSVDAWVTVRVLNLAGRPVATVVSDRAYAAGPSSAVWNLRSASGTRVPSGRYLCVLQARTEDGQTLHRTCPLNVGR